MRHGGDRRSVQPGRNGRAGSSCGNAFPFEAHLERWCIVHDQICEQADVKS